MGNLSRYFEDVEIVNGLKIEYVEDISGKHLRPPDIYMNYRVNNSTDILMKEIRGYDIYRVENPDEGLISSKFMILRIRYRRLVRVVINCELPDGIIIHSEVIDRFKGYEVYKDLESIDYYVPEKKKIKVRFDRGKVITIKYKHIDDELRDLTEKLKDINEEIKKSKLEIGLQNEVSKEIKVINIDEGKKQG